MLLNTVLVLFLGLVSTSVSAYRIDLKNVTCKNVHGLHCGTYLLKVKGQNDTFLGQNYYVRADALAHEPSDAWARFLREEYRFIPRLTTVQALNVTTNFRPLIGVTDYDNCNFHGSENTDVPYINAVTKELSFDSWARTSWNATAATGLALQLLNSTAYGVQVATCTPGFLPDLFHSPTVNIFNIDEELPFWCEPIEFEPVCPKWTDWYNI